MLLLCLVFSSNAIAEYYDTVLQHCAMLVVLECFSSTH
jgi:hypothetical protein